MSPQPIAAVTLEARRAGTHEAHQALEARQALQAREAWRTLWRRG
ncbi:MAG: hypothetical protein M0035_03855 [Actinomycetota bacterium]|nr:hypothetical protein [Actinomycetota bacterium]